MAQQVRIVRRKPTVKRFDGNLNLTNALFTAFHESLFALWPSAFPSRRAQWMPRLWRFRGRNVDPGVLRGGIIENVMIDKYADPRGNMITSLWRDRVKWRNKSHLSDRVEEIQYVPLLFPVWMWLGGPQHTGGWARRKAQQISLANISAQKLVLTQAQATLSPAFGDVRYTGGRIVVT